jgi:general stress protein CsbA
MKDLLFVLKLVILVAVVLLYKYVGFETTVVTLLAAIWVDRRPA